MAVRGTTFRVSVEFDADGNSYTQVSVYEGTVEIKLIYPDGTISENSVFVEGGRQAIVLGTDETSVFLVEDEEVDYEELLLKTLEFLNEMLDHGNYPFTIPQEELQEIIRVLQLPYHTVTFYNGGSVFGTQTVREENTARQPTLMPTASGSWDYDFTEPIMADTEIYWQDTSGAES